MLYAVEEAKFVSFQISFREIITTAYDLTVKGHKTPYFNQYVNGFVYVLIVSERIWGFLQG